MRQVRLFVASPGDVREERSRLREVVKSLNGAFGQFLRFELILWEDAVYNAHDGGFQAQINERAKPGECDIVVAIFWRRLGMNLPDSFPYRMLDGKPYPSGTGYEVLSALEARRASGKKPDVYVFRKNCYPVDTAEGDKARSDAEIQWQRLEEFFAHYFQVTDKRIFRAVERFRTLEEFAEKVEQLLRIWIRNNVLQGIVWPIEEKGSPFRGLEPFDAKHAKVYCGRGRKIERAIDELKCAARRGKPFLLIPGASGSGKSSIMRAGIAPRLIEPGVVEGVDVWRIALMRPATDRNPLMALARALFVTGDPKLDDPGGFGMALPELANRTIKTPDLLSGVMGESLEEGVKAITTALEDVGLAEAERRGYQQPLTAKLLLLVDQLEDVFAAHVASDQRAQFAGLLKALVNSQRVWLIATLRGDMYERMITERPFAALKDICGQYDLTPPGADELDEIVHRSAEASGLQYDQRHIKIEGSPTRLERLDDMLLQDAAGENTLPLLQFALNLLFEKCWVGRQSKVLSIDDYEEIGRLDGALNLTAEAALARLVRPNETVKFPLDKDVRNEIERSINPILETLLRKLVMPVSRQRQGSETTAVRALTAHVVPMNEVQTDEPTRRLVDTLLQARILLASRTDEGSSLRIAHDRVMTSWERARILIERNRDFFRVRESIEHERERWQQNQRSAQFLIPPGAPITQAEEVVRRFGDEIAKPDRDFVAISSRRARRRQRLMTMATLVFALVAVVASVASLYARHQRRRAIENYVAARGTVGHLVTSIAQKMRDQEGFDLETINLALSQVVDLLKNLEAQDPNDPELKRIRASMHFEFARAYQVAKTRESRNKERALDHALGEAEEALKIRSELVDRDDKKLEWLSDKAASLVQLGDIYRALAGDNKASKDLQKAREAFEQAFAIRTKLYESDPANPVWTYGLSQALVRIGDVEISSGHIAEAKTNYQRALDLNMGLMKRDIAIGDAAMEDLQHELGWCLKKVARGLDSDQTLPDCLAMNEKALAVRRYLAEQKPGKFTYKRDVAWSLQDIGIVKMKKKDFAGAMTAFFVALDLRQQLNKDDPNHVLCLLESAQTLHQIGICMQKTGQPGLAAGYLVLTRDAFKSVPSKDMNPFAEKERGNVDTELASALKNLGSDKPQAASETDLLKRLKEQANRNMDMEVAKAESQQEPGILKVTWSELKDRLLQAAPVKMAKND